MSVRPILLLGDPRLRLAGAQVDAFDKQLAELIDDLVHTMRAAPGAGLAAPQLGEAQNVAVVEAHGRIYELVNPRIVRENGDQRDYEGCLSIPGYVAEVTRREKVWVEAQDRRGRLYKFSEEGFLARAVQHELDHLKGKLYIDYLDSLDDLLPVVDGKDEDPEDPANAPKRAARERRAKAARAHSH
jgi:peptide deformylase